MGERSIAVNENSNDRWIRESITSILGIPKHEIGIIGKDKAKLGKLVTMATIQSLPKQTEKIQNQFETIFVDECYHIPARQMEQVKITEGALTLARNYKLHPGEYGQNDQF